MEGKGIKGFPRNYFEISPKCNNEKSRSLFPVATVQIKIMGTLIPPGAGGETQKAEGISLIKQHDESIAENCMMSFAPKSKV